MKLPKHEVKEKIEDYFSKKELKSEETKKIKKLAMSYRISLKNHRKRFCKKCYSDLKNGSVRISKNYKTITCKCGFTNKFKIS